MIEKILSLRLQPGVYKNGTKYQAKNRWFDANLVRWYEGIMAPVGGWRNVASSVDSGTATGAQSSTTLQDTSKTWVVNQWAGRTVSIISGTGAGQTRTITSNTATILTVSVAWGTIPVAGSSLYQISGINLQVSGKPRGSHGWKSNAAVSLLGVGTHTNLYLYTDGLLTDITPFGLTTGAADGLFVSGNYGSGAFGSGYYGTGSGALTLTPPATWQLDNFGELLVGSLSSDGRIFQASVNGAVAVLLQEESGTATGAQTSTTLQDTSKTWVVNQWAGRTVTITAGTGSGQTRTITSNTATILTVPVWGVTPVAGSSQYSISANAPISNTAIVVTPERFIVALGASGQGRKVQWASQESLTDWAASATNSAGSFTLTTKGRLMAGRRTRRQTMLWTDVDIYAMTFIGGTFVYAFEQLGDNCGLIGPNACIALGDRVFWMSYGKFFEYDGAIKPIPCDVADHVFNDLDQSQRAKIAAVPMTLFDEVWWFYPSKTADNENAKYVAYNFREGHWHVGTLPRASGIDRGIYEYPVLLDPDGFLYEHEFGANRTGQSVYAETGPIELGDGDQLLRLQQIIPDEQTLGDVRMTLYTSMYPTATEQSAGPFTAANPTAVRLTGRWVRLRVEEVNATNWRVGVPRIGVIPAGKR